MAGSAVAAAVLGVLPHVLHHAGPLAGAALLGGVGGSLVFGAAGLVLSVPFLLKVRRRTGGWRVPAMLLATFAVVFSLSSFVVGPAISGGDEASGGPGARSHRTARAARGPPPRLTTSNATSPTSCRILAYPLGVSKI